MSDVTFESLNEAFDNIDHSINVMASRVVAVALEKIEEILAPYPPQPDRMRSGHFNGYVRGIGTFPKSAFNADDKQPGGFSVKKNARKTIKASLSENARLKRLGDQQGRQDLANALTTKKVGQIRLTSQQMDKRFKTVVSAKGANVVGVLTNLADYSGFVLGPKEGDPHQTDFHNKTGWVSADDAVEQAWPMIDTEVDSAIDQFIAEFGVQ